MEEISRRALARMLDTMGYRIKGKPVDYINRLNPGPPFPVRSFFVVEGDTGLHFANVNARRDANFEALQWVRSRRDLSMDGRAVQLD